MQLNIGEHEQWRPLVNELSQNYRNLTVKILIPKWFKIPGFQARFYIGAGGNWLPNLGHAPKASTYRCKVAHFVTVKIYQNAFPAAQDPAWGAQAAPPKTLAGCGRDTSP